jgi:putative SOS response-associated peptidase YedK
LVKVTRRKFWHCLSQVCLVYLLGRELDKRRDQLNPETKKNDVVWFALGDDRPPFCFANIWAKFKGDRGTSRSRSPGPHLVYGFLTTSPNAIVEAHPPEGDASDPDD